MTMLLEEGRPAVAAVLGRPDLPGDVAEAWAEFLEDGQRTQTWMLAHIHGTAFPQTTPNLLDLARAMQRFEAAVVELHARAVDGDPSP